MKKFIKVFVVISALLCLVGCKNKEKMDENGFIEAMNKHDFTITDVTQDAGATGLKKGLIAMKNDGSYQIEFYIFDSTEKAKEVYNTNKNNFENSASGASTKTEKDMKNYSKFTLNNDGKYSIVSRIGETLIYINANSDYKDEIKDVLKEIGY